MPELKRNHEGQAVPLHGVIPTESPPPAEEWQIAAAVLLFAFFIGIVVAEFRKR